MSSELSPQPIPTSSAPLPLQNRRRRWRLTASVAILMVFIIGILIWRSSGSDHDRNDALKAAKAGDFARAEPLLKSALQTDPMNAEVAGALARGYAKQENSTEAEAALDHWLELRPDDREARRLRFEWHRKMKDLAKAYPDGRRLFELEPADAQLPRLLMGQAFSLGQFEESETYCRTALLSQSGDRNLRLMLAEIRRARNDPTEAGVILDKLIKDFPAFSPALLTRGILYIDSGQPAQAIPLLREVVRVDSTRPRNARYKLAVALEQCGEVDEARRVTAELRQLQAVANAEEAIKNQPNNLQLQTLQGEMLLAGGQTSDGLRFLEAVLIRDPEFPPAHRVLATYYERNGQPDKAVEHRRRAGL